MKENPLYCRKLQLQGIFFMHKKRDLANNLFQTAQKSDFCKGKIVKKVENHKNFPDIFQKRLDKIPRSGI